MLSQIVSRVRRHFHRSQKRQDPPDLRRWSDFKNPFPSVTPGGYTRYYAKHGFPKPKSSPTKPSPSPIQTTLSPVTSTSTLTSSSSSPASLSSPSSGHKRTRTRTLSTIPETRSNSSIGSRGMQAPSLSNSSSLRRRRRRLLRTPSIVRDFPAAAPVSPSTDSEAISSSASSQTHSDETHPTSLEDGNNSDPPSPSQQHCPSSDEYDRPDSRSSYRTARSYFSDV